MSKCENFTVQYPPLSPAQLAELRRKMRLAWERLPKNVNLAPIAFLCTKAKATP